MSAIETAWLVGEFVLASNATVTVNATPKVIAAGRYYLRDSTAARSLVDKLADIIDDVVPGSTVTICKDRLLRIVSGGGALTLAIPASLQAVTGLAASPTVGTTVTADECNHGTHVAGIIAASGGNGVGIAGLAWNVRLLPVVVVNGCSGFEANVATGLTWAVDQGARLVTLLATCFVLRTV